MSLVDLFKHIVIGTAQTLLRTNPTIRVVMDVNEVLEATRRQERMSNETFTQPNDMNNKEAKHLETLGLTKSSMTQESLKSAWKAKAKIHHPDRGGSLAKMQEINEAYEYLKE